MKPDFKLVLDALQTQLSEQSMHSVVVGILPPAGGISLVASSGTSEAYLSGGCLLRMQISVNAKSRVESAAMDMLSDAVAIASACRTETEDMQIIGCSLRRTPAQLGVDASGCFLFGCSVEMLVFFS